MSPKIIFKREEIVRAAFEMVKESGFRDFSARKIADALSSSTAPVYSYFSSMEELKIEVLGLAEKLMIEYTLASYTKSVFLNMGTGYVLFAQDYGELFRALLLENSKTRMLIEKFMKSLNDELYRDMLISLLPKKERKEVIDRMTAYTHGLASFLCVGMIDRMTKKEIINVMYNTGRDVIDSALKRAGVNEHYEI